MLRSEVAKKYFFEYQHLTALIFAVLHEKSECSNYVQKTFFIFNTKIKMSVINANLLILNYEYRYRYNK